MKGKVDWEEAKERLFSTPEERQKFEQAKWRHRIGELIAHQRKALSLSQQDLAQKLDIQQTEIEQIEQGEEVPLETIQRVADAVGLKLKNNE